jgi:hypothetical protein
VIAVETKPERMSALQWHQPGDAADLGEQSYRFAGDLRYGLHSMTGMQRLTPGDWIVFAAVGWPQVYSSGEFHNKFKIIEEGQT